MAHFVLALLTAATVQVHFAGSGPAASGMLRLRPIHGAVTKDLAITVPGNVKFEAEAIPYIAELHVPGFWMPVQTIDGRGGDHVSLPVRRTGAIAATVRTPGEVFVRFDGGETRCSLDHCELPEGIFDLRISRSGHVPQYFWGIKVEAGHTTNLGTLSFVSGASLSGRLQLEEGEFRDVQLSLKSASVAIKPLPNGFFSAGPIPPGEYLLTATQRGLVSAPVPVTIREGWEASLREPVVLAKPRRLSILVSPPTDPIALGWTIALKREGPAGTEPVPAAEGAASLDGSWTAENLPPGEYEVIVRPSGGPVWRIEHVTIADALTTKQIHVPSIRFTGTVRLGGQPLAARLIFGGSHTANAIPWRSDEKGEFRGWMPLPPDRRWTVTITSEHPPIDVTLSEVEMHLDEANGTASIKIMIPRTSLQGEVVDEKNRSVSHALVNVSPRDHTRHGSQIRSDEHGTFSLEGLPPGQYRLTATDYLKESDGIEIELPADAAEPTGVRLQVKPYRQWSGRVTTPDGRAVSGARIVAAAVDVPIVAAYPATSDSEGRFKLLVPASANTFDFLVAPPGFTCNVFRRAYSDELHIIVNPHGGTLVLDIPSDRALEPVLWHNGSVTSGYTLLSGWVGAFEESHPERTRIRVPQMDPGDYTFCLVPTSLQLSALKPSGDCQSIHLAPYAEARITLSRGR